MHATEFNVVMATVGEGLTQLGRSSTVLQRLEAEARKQFSGGVVVIPEVRDILSELLVAAKMLGDLAIRKCDMLGYTIVDGEIVVVPDLSEADTEPDEEPAEDPVPVPSPATPPTDHTQS